MIQHEQLEHEMFQRNGILVGSGFMHNATSENARMRVGLGQQPDGSNGLMCVPNITYKSILPAQTSTSPTKQAASAVGQSQYQSSTSGTNSKMSNLT